MGKVLLLPMLLVAWLFSLELAVVGDKDFPEENLTKEEIKSFFLKRRSFIDNEKVLVMNHENETPLRNCFEEKILEKGKHSLERYWRKAYYKGKQPPKIVSSNEMLFLYMESVQPSLGYSDFNDTFKKEVKILYLVEC